LENLRERFILEEVEDLLAEMPVPVEELKAELLVVPGIQPLRIPEAAEAAAEEDPKKAETADPGSS
jgi:hypothetical protein